MLRPRRLTSGKYTYEALTDADSIRLIRLYPARNQAAEVKCEVFHTTLRQVKRGETEYTALSYVWGDSQIRTKVYVKDCAISVTTTLETALRHVRNNSKDSGTLNVWADGISINQENEDEKSQQVQQMGEIYKNAHRTIIFLGEYNKDSEKVVSRAVERLDNKSQINRYDQIQAMGHVLLRPWFHRVWVLQELVLSPNPVIQIKGFRFPWNKFLGMCTSLPIIKDVFVSDYGLSGDLSSPFMFNTNVVNDMARAIEFYKETKEISAKSNDTQSAEGERTADLAMDRLLVILAARRGLGAADSRDMVFAHLGLVESGIQVDYRKSTRQVYNELARRHIAASNSLEILSHVEDRVLVMPAPLGSWVPNWMVPWSTKRISMMRNGLSRFRTGSLPKDLAWLAEISKDFGYANYKILPRCRGFTLFWLNDVSCTFQVSNKLPKEHRMWAELSEQCEILFKKKYKWERGSIAPKMDTEDASCLGSLPAIQSRNAEDQHESPNKISQSLLDHFDRTLEHPDEESILNGRSLSQILDFDRLRSKVTTSRPQKRWVLVPNSAKPGDLICFLQGSSVPFVVRRPSGMGYHSKDIIDIMIVGECFLEGAMYDQAYPFLASGGYTKKASRFLIH